MSNNAFSSALSNEQKSELPNPFELQDYEIVHKVYLTHFNDDESYDKTILIELVSNIISASSQISATNSNSVLNTQVFSKPDFPDLKRISCQMITTRGTPECVHLTTMWILQRLKGFSWDAKALITLAAFCLEYGEYWHLYRLQSSETTIGNSLKQLNQVVSRTVSYDITDLATFLLEVLRDIIKWSALSALDYNLDEVPSLSEALHEIPLVVYWTLATIVASTGNLVGISEHTLSVYKKKLTEVSKSLKDHLENSQVEIDGMNASGGILAKYDKIKDVVGFLRLVTEEGKGSDQIPSIFIDKSKGIEVFKNNYVLLFISSLDSIGDEISLLNSIYKRLQDNQEPKINDFKKEDFKKEDFKILWIPIVDIWDEKSKEQFRKYKESIKWHVLEYFSELPGKIIIKERLNYSGDPIVSVIDPQGQVMNENAMHIIFEWGFDAFPFRKTDGADIRKRWKWFWNLMRKVDYDIEEKNNKDRYIFIYGGDDTKWIQNFTKAIGSIKKKQNIGDIDFTIEYYQIGKEDPAKIPYFWMGIDGRKQNKACQGKIDCEIQNAVKMLLCLRRDPSGWVLLSKGQHVTLTGHGEPMYQTVADFDKWKNNVADKESFDVAFKEYYHIKLKEISSRVSCAYNSSNVLATISCPNPSCGRVMEVSSVNYMCCHRDDPKSCCN
ncbi:protein SIEVE ELEMENT OCCLUSION B-like isoform X2 [Cicer arietinum]|uniref:Protein SIEVE ELEMENT OCCLUSION B-like isoform X2 n=1 Tax=Cicer arietinum TaxID=3827 RepID=A0A1S2XVW2_CICAR|nr:protein SIEVE ELEMENT OCCLUSION B-like isoform X2 [Cicer arietinum]